MLSFTLVIHDFGLELYHPVHCKKWLSVFPSPAGMSLTKLSLVGNNLIFPGHGEFGKWHPGWDVKTANLFLQFKYCSMILGK